MALRLPDPTDPIYLALSQLLGIVLSIIIAANAPTESHGPSGAQTAGRALELLELVAYADKPRGLADLASSVNFNKSTVYRLMRELEAHNFVAREHEGKRYVVGAAAIALATQVSRRITVRGLARVAMERIAEYVPETVSLHLRHLDYRICIEVVEGRFPVRRIVPLGETLPLWAGPSGKAILAFLPSAEAARLIECGTSEGEVAEVIERQLESIRRYGYLITESDRLAGVGGLSVPIFDSHGVVAALTVSGPVDRWSEQVMHATAPLIVAECAMVSRSLGHVLNVT